MEFKITTHQYADLAVSQTIAPPHQHFQVAGAMPVVVDGPFGAMIFQEIISTGFTIWYSNYLLNEQMSFYGAAGQEVLELTILLHNELDFDLGGIGKQQLKSSQFTLTYTPYIENDAVFAHKGLYTTFDIHMEPAFLATYAAAFPTIGRFMEQVEKRNPCQLLNRHFLINEKIKLLLPAILKNPYQGDMRNLFIHNKVSDLLFHLFEATTLSPVPHIPQLTMQDIKRLHDARNIIAMHLDESFTIPVLAKKAGINELKLKTGFKQLFGMPVHAYVISLRLEQAKFLLLETPELISNIAYKTGYRSVSQFSMAFTKMFGISPLKFRNTGRRI